MKNNIKIICCLLLGLAFFACDSFDFDGEQYRNEIYLLSNSQMIYDRQVADMNKDTDIIYLVAGLSGTRNSDKSFSVTLRYADSLFNAYNKSNFDIDNSRFAHMLPDSCYEIPSMTETERTIIVQNPEDETQVKETETIKIITGQIPAGETQVKFPVILKKLESLSPDSTYFLSFKIDPEGTDTFNPQKREVLLRIFKENDYSTTRQNVYYNYTTSTVANLDTENPLVRRITSANQVFPLGRDSVRMLAGEEAMGEYKTALERINAGSIKVTVGAQTAKNPLARQVEITSYRTVDVVQLTPSGMYDNTYLINIISTPDGRSTYYKEFRLHYMYKLKGGSHYKEVKAVLRMEYSPRADLL